MAGGPCAASVHRVSIKALILVDIQNDFLPSGARAVADGDAVIPIANGLQSAFPVVVATQDWHPANHGSFAASHPGKKVFEQIELNGLPQTLWPVHCVQGTRGAELAAELNRDRIANVFPKGTDAGIDSYSGLFDNGHPLHREKAMNASPTLSGRERNHSVAPERGYDESVLDF